MEFVRNIRGVVFYATPHRGSELANWGFRLLCGRYTDGTPWEAAPDFGC